VIRRFTNNRTVAKQHAGMRLHQEKFKIQTVRKITYFVFAKYRYLVTT